MDAIAEAADRTSGAVYDHFGSKDGLLFALLEGWVDDVAAVTGAELSTATTLEERMGVMWRNVVDPVVGDGRWIALEHELWSYATRNEEARRYLARRYRAVWDARGRGRGRVGRRGRRRRARADRPAARPGDDAPRRPRRGDRRPGDRRPVRGRQPDRTERQPRDRDRIARRHRPPGRHLGPGRPPRPVRPAPGRGPGPLAPGAGRHRVLGHHQARRRPGHQPGPRHLLLGGGGHVHPQPGRGGPGPAAADHPEHGPAQAQPLSAPGVPGLHAADDRPAGRRDRASGGPGRRRASASRARWSSSRRSRPRCRSR